MSFSIDRGEILALVGESGSGKTVTAHAVLGLLPAVGHRAGSVQLTDDPAERPAHEQPNLLATAPALGADAVGRGAWPAGGHGVPGAADRAEPGQDGRLAAGRGAARPSADRPPRGAEPSRRAADPGRYPRARGARRRLPAPALRRPEAAGGDRAGPGQRPGAADRRRADHGARRQCAGGDPAAAGRAAGATRHGRAVDHPQHGCGRRPRRPGAGDAQRPDGRARRSGVAVQRSRSPTTPGSCWARCRDCARSESESRTERAASGGRRNRCHARPGVPGRGRRLPRSARPAVVPRPARGHRRGGARSGAGCRR